MNYDALFAEARWALEVFEAADIYFDDIPRYSRIDCDLIKGDCGFVRQQLDSRSAALLFVGKSFVRRVEVEIAPGAIRPGPRDIELMSMEPLSEFLAAQSTSLVAVFLPDLPSH